jgi:transposase InsO family protein
MNPKAELLLPDPAAGTTASSIPASSAASEQHLERIQQIIQLEKAASQHKRRRDPEAQRPRRRLEDQIRQTAVDFYQHTVQAGGTLKEAAECLWLCPRTLRQWCYDGQTDQGQAPLLGRPLLGASAEQRTAVGDWLRQKGLVIGVPRLCRQFPDVARAELAEVLAGYRAELRHEQWRSVRVLHWQAPGRVWAIDFAEPSLLKATCSLPPIDAKYPYLLAVRDLASGYQLAWLPVAQADAATVQMVLKELFALHGAPLVLKADNGGPFRADETKAFLERAGIFGLFSPPACPGYNGSIEAAIGSLKKRTQAEACRCGHPGIWTSADVEAARTQGNGSHPLRHNGRTPTAVWNARTEITMAERFRFALAVESQHERARQELGIDQGACLDHWQEGKVDRKAIERALVEHDYLLFTRRRIPLTIAAGKVTSSV